MTVPADLTLVTELSTTADLRDLRFPRWLAASLGALFAQDDVLVTWVPAGGGDARATPWSALGEDEVAGIYALGGIALSDLQGREFEATIEWRRVPAATGRGSGRPPLEQNTVTVRLDPARVRDDAFRAAYLRWCGAAAAEQPATYGAGYDQHVYRHRLDHVEGLGAGLRDVYWLNLFGKEFCELIGTERLLSAPAAHTERLPSGHVLVLADDAVLDPPPHGDAREPWPPTRALVEPIAEHIGREFFVRPRSEPGAPPVMGLLRGLAFLRGKGSGFDDPGVMAERRPSFDYSGMPRDG